MEEETNTQSEQTAPSQTPPPDVTQVNTEPTPERTEEQLAADKAEQDRVAAELPSDGEAVVEGTQEEVTESATETTGEATPSES